MKDTNNSFKTLTMKTLVPEGDHVNVLIGNDGNAAAKQPRMPIRGLKNPNSESRLKDTNNSLNTTMESLVPEGDHVFLGKGLPRYWCEYKVEANFRSLVADKVFGGVNISIPRKFVEKAKHGLKRIMINAKGFFFFKFDTPAGLEGRSSFARCLIESNSEANLKESITISIPDLDGPGFTKETIRVVTTPVVNDTNDGFQQVMNKKCKNNRNPVGNKLPKGVPVVKGFQVGKDFAFQPRDPKAGSNSSGTHSEVISKASSSKNTKECASLTEKSTFTDRRKDKDVVDTGQMKMSNITTPNPFTVLGASTPAYTFLMFSISSWNIRGLNRSPKQKEVRQVVNENNLSVCAILESHVDVVVVYDTCKKVCRRWKWTSNGSICPKGSRIILGWNDDLMDVITMAQTNQTWVMMGDFNADSKFGGPFIWWVFLLLDQNRRLNGILKKIDMIMGNLQFNDDFLGSFAIFQPCRILDHSPCVLHIPTVTKSKSKPFKFTNFLVYKEGFCEVVESGWNVNFEGFAMYQVVKRLKGLKSPFCKLLHDHGNLYEHVNRIRVELNEAQKAIDRDPSSSILREEHAYYLLAFKEAQLDEERFLKQKAKAEWLKAGDSNTTYFHRTVKSKYARNRIDMVSDSSNTHYDGNQIPCAFVNHYDQFLGTEDVTDIEVKNVLFSIGDDKAPGPNSFTAAFFRKAWDVVGGDITYAIRDFFSNGKLLKELNHNIIALIPKLIANRVKEGLGDIVSINQSAFVPGRRISDNILLTQELMRNYHRRCGPPRCAFKVDIQKAYDTVDWKFLETILGGFGFHPKMVQWIMVYVSGASYSICVDGNLHGWFKAQDDLFLFARGHPNSVSVIMDALEEFKQVLGLVPSALPVRYLGVPLISTRLIYQDCKILVEKLKISVNDWRNKFLSLVGRLQLIWSVLSSIHIYWASVFILLTRIVHELEQLMRGFLWFQGEMKKGKAKLHVPLLLDDMDDVILWQDRDGVLRSFSVACFWDTIRAQADMVQWYNVVWFPHSIPRHAIHMWLVVQQKLKTQDRLWQWDVHALCGMDSISHWLADVIAFIVPISKGKTVISILSRIVVAATSYYIWLKRNGRLFKKKTSSPDQIVQVILSMVRLKLVTFKFKKMSTRSHLLLDQWKIPSYCIAHDGSSRRQTHLDRICSCCVAAGLRDARLILCADRSFVSTTFSALLDVIPSTLDTRLLGHPFNVDLILVELNSFDVIVGMDWLAKYHPVVVCDEKIVRISYGDEVLIIKDDGCNGGSKSKLSIISCTKTQKYIQKGCQVYLAQVTAKKTDDKSEEKQLEDVSIVRDFSKVFLEDLPGLPPTRKVEFQIDLVPGAAPVA
ncbi:hypothetical protein Tco_0453469 [Tanacetum coccineum]